MKKISDSPPDEATVPIVVLRGFFGRSTEKAKAFGSKIVTKLNTSTLSHKQKSGFIIAAAISTFAMSPNPALSEETAIEEPANLEIGTGNKWFNNETGLQLGLAASYGKKGDDQITRGDIAFGYSFGKITPYGEFSYLDLDGNRHDGHATGVVKKKQN